MAVYIVPGVGSITIDSTELQTQRCAQYITETVEDTVRRSANGLLYKVRSNAPQKTGALRSGIIPSPAAERTATPYRIVYDVYMDEGKNEIFVKMSKAGKRYYYPASQEYGFKTRKKQKIYKRRRRAKAKVSRVEGKKFMRNSAVEFFPEHTAAVGEAVTRAARELSG